MRDTPSVGAGCKRFTRTLFFSLPVSVHRYAFCIIDYSHLLPFFLVFLRHSRFAALSLELLHRMEVPGNTLLLLNPFLLFSFLYKQIKCCQSLLGRVDVIMNPSFHTRYNSTLMGEQLEKWVIRHDTGWWHQTRMDLYLYDEYQKFESNANSYLQIFRQWFNDAINSDKN